MRVTRLTRLLALVAVAAMASATHAAFIVEADNVAPAGKANANFSSLGHSFSTTPSFAAGLSGNQSIFGNPANATGPDQYTFRYTPGTDADNTTYTPLQNLGNSQATDADGLGPIAPVYLNLPQLATGATGGGTGLYNVYFTTPQTTGSNPLGSQFVITHDGILSPTALNPVNTNNGGTGPDTSAPGDAIHVGGANDRWLKIASLVHLTAGTAYTVTQTANAATFVSQRAHGVMWEFVRIPEPATFALAGMALVGMASTRRRTALAKDVK